MAGNQPVQQQPASQRKNLGVAVGAVLVSFGMLGLAYASVPLYRLFCQTTGFGGTTQVAKSAPGAATNQEITIRFDANTATALGWAFHPKQQEMKVRLGDPNLAFYVAHNNTDRTVTGSAVFNVTPPSAGAYFNKIQCFCFSEQTLKAGETVDMPVQFFVDPEIMKDPDSNTIREITLSYTFYPVAKPATATAETKIN